MIERRALTGIALIVLWVAACGVTMPAPPSSDENPPTASITAPPAAVTIIPPSESVVTVDIPHEWKEIHSPAFGVGSQVTGIVAAGEGLLMHGVSNTLATVWTSSDLEAWVETSLPGSVDTVPLAAVPDGGAIIVATAADGSTTGSALWRKEGEAGWQRIEGPDAVAGGWEVRGLAWTGERFIAVGAARQGRGDELASWSAAAWTSADGLAWEAAPIDLPSGRGSRLTAVSLGPAGAVAVGAIEAGGSVDGLVVRSVDGGQPWTRSRVAEFETRSDDRVFSVASSTALWIATSTRRAPECGDAMCAENHGAVVASTDGQSWEALAAGAEPPAPIAGWGSVLLAYTSAGDQYQVVRSDDGFTWSPVGPPTPAPLGSVRFGLAGDTLVVAGPDMTNDQALSVWSLALTR